MIRHLKGKFSSSMTGSGDDVDAVIGIASYMIEEVEDKEQDFTSPR